MTPPKGKDLVETRVARERDWALEAWNSRLTFPQIRALAQRPVSEGGLGYAISLSGIKGLVQAARNENGDLTMSREERAARQADEVDVRARFARQDLEAARAQLMRPKPDRAEYLDPVEYGLAITSYWKAIEAATKLVESADRRLESAQARESRLHGLDAPTRIEAEVTQRDGVLDDLNAALIALGREPVEVER